MVQYSTTHKCNSLNICFYLGNLHLFWLTGESYLSDCVLKQMLVLLVFCDHALFSWQQCRTLG